MARVNLALSAKLGNGFDRLERQYSIDTPVKMY
jgi:hypothetical protein